MHSGSTAMHEAWRDRLGAHAIPGPAASRWMVRQAGIISPIGVAPRSVNSEDQSIPTANPMPFRRRSTSSTTPPSLESGKVSMTLPRGWESHCLKLGRKHRPYYIGVEKAISSQEI